jgi:hypothetical protein
MRSRGNGSVNSHVGAGAEHEPLGPWEELHPAVRAYFQAVAARMLDDGATVR